MSKFDFEANRKPAPAPAPVKPVPEPVKPFDFEANRGNTGNIPRETIRYDFEANRKPVPEPLPFAKPFDFEANRGNIPRANIRYDFANNPEGYKPRGQTITIVEDENRERNSWGYNSMLAGTTLLGVGAILGGQMYQIYKGVERARGEMREPRFINRERTGLDDNPEMPELLSLEDSRIPRSSEVITQSQILNPPADVDTLPDRGLASNPFYNEIVDDAVNIANRVLAQNRQRIRENNLARTKPIYKTGNMPSLKKSFSNLVGEPKGRFSKGGGGAEFDFSKRQKKLMSDNLQMRDNL